MSKRVLIQCTDLSIRLGRERVIKSLSFEVLWGEHTILKGESGSGKSTILKTLLGFLKPDAGSIHIALNDEAGSLRANCAWLPQDLNMGSGTVKEVILKPFEFERNRHQKPGMQTITSIFKTLGLTEEDLQKQFRDLSTGQRQRVGLAICHLLDKPILLLDEPTSALDSVSKQRAAELLLAKSDKTIISTSHDPYWVERGDKIIDLK